MDDAPISPTPRRRRRWLRRVAFGVTCVVLIAGGIAYWALDRFVIDHVEISDVSAYEQQARATTSTPATTAGTVADEPLTAEPSTAETSTPETVVPQLTDTSYTSATMTIEISKVVTGSGNDQLVYFVADVQLNDATTLRGGFAENKFGTNIVENTSTIAERYDAIWAINGDYYGFRESGIVIRNGVLFRDDPARTGLAMYTDGRVEIYDEQTTTGEELLAAGVWNTLSFGPALVDDGVAVEGIDNIEIDTNFGNHSIQGSHPRTGVGVISPNHFVFVAVDGRSRGYSRGVTLPQFADLFVQLGATEAYNLDGGGSTTMYFNGEVVNLPLGRGKERGTSDILYLVEPEVVSA